MSRNKLAFLNLKFVFSKRQKKIIHTAFKLQTEKHERGKVCRERRGQKAPYYRDSGGRKNGLEMEEDKQRAAGLINTSNNSMSGIKA